MYVNRTKKVVPECAKRKEEKSMVDVAIAKCENYEEENVSKALKEVIALLRRIRFYKRRFKGCH